MTTAGLEPAVFEELSRMGLAAEPPGRGFVSLAADAIDGARIVLSIRSASRVILEVADGLPCESDPLLGALCKLPWEDLLPAGTPWAVRATGRSDGLRHSGYAQRLAKDGIRDRFQAVGKTCPPVDPEKPRLLVDLRIDKRSVFVGIDLGTGSLHERGTGRKMKAPLREHVAAGLALLAKPSPDQPLVDPFCGSGTLIAESACIAMGIPAGRRIEQTALPRLADFRRLPLGELSRDLANTIPPLHAPFLAYDSEMSAVRVARVSLEHLGLSDHIKVEHAPVASLDPATLGGSGLLISNPPWGLRLDAETATAAWKQLGTLARSLSGWRLALLSGDPAITRGLGLKAERRFPVRVGGVDARLLTYRMFER